MAEDTRASLERTQEQLRQQEAELKEQKRLQRELTRNQRKLTKAQKKTKKAKIVSDVRRAGWDGAVLLLNERAVPVQFVDRPAEIVGGTVRSRNEVRREEPKFLNYTAGRKFRIDYIIEDGDYFDAVCHIPEKPSMYIWCHSYNPFTGEWSGDAELGLSREDVMERLMGRTVTWDNTSTTSQSSSNVRKTNKKAVRNTRAPKKPKTNTSKPKASNNSRPKAKAPAKKAGKSNGRRR